MRKFEWDDSEARASFSKHGVSFELAARIRDDQSYLIIPVYVYEGEERRLAKGRGYQTDINAILRTYVSQQERQERALTPSARR